MQGILSGPIALLGTSSRNGLLMEQDRINAAGGFLGRPIEFVFRDLKGQPQEAAHVARELVNSTGCELLIDAEASSASFAVQEVVRDLGSVACLHTTARPPRSAPHRLLCSASGRARRHRRHHTSRRIRQWQELNKWAPCSAGLCLRSRHHGAVPAVLQAVQARRRSDHRCLATSSTNQTSPKSSPS